MSKVKMKRYKITYAPRVKIAQLALNPIDDWDVDNVNADYVLVQVGNHKDTYTQDIYVEATNKATATALFAVRIADSVPIGKVCKFETDSLVIDAISHILDITEVME